MAVLDVHKMWSRFSSSVSADEVSVEVGYQIVVEAVPETSLYEVYAAPGLPAMGSQYSDDFPYIYAASASVERVSPIMYLMTINYTGQGGSGENNDFGGVNITWSDAESEQAIDEDWNGNPIVTVLNEAIEGVTMNIADQVVTIQRKFLAFSPSAVHAYRHSTNSDTFLGYPPGTGRLIAYSATSQNGGIWDVSASIQFRYPYRTTPAKAWYARVRHEGYYIKKDNKKIRALDEAGEPMTRPVLLKQDGTEETEKENAFWLEVQRYGSLPYNALGLL
jgi:hypothetical protein